MVVNETLKVIRQRRSCRGFRDDQISNEELQAILEAGLYAPNAGDQAWHFTVVQNKALLNRLNGIAKEMATQLGDEFLRTLGNNKQFDCFYGAPTVILVSASEQGIPLEADCAAATENMLLAAESMGLGSCWIYFVMFAFYGPPGPALLKELKIPDGYKPYCAALFGYKNGSVADAADRKPNLITYLR